MRKKTVRFQVPSFQAYWQPKGHLIPQNKECIALMYYYTMAIAAFAQEKQTLVYEGEPDIAPKYERLYRNAAMMYGAKIEEMYKFWPQIDKQVDQDNVLRVLEGQPKISKLPEHLRFVSKPIKVKKAH